LRTDPGVSGRVVLVIGLRVGLWSTDGNLQKITAIPLGHGTGVRRLEAGPARRSPGPSADRLSTATPPSGAAARDAGCGIMVTDLPDATFGGRSTMEVLRGKSDSEADPGRAERDAAAGPATQPAAAVALPVEAQPALGPGSLLNDRYELGRVIGCGGMSTVHCAYDRRTGRAVAVKISRPESEMVDAERRTRREVDILSGLDDPGLVGLLDAGLGDGATPAYLVTEFVNGPTLAQWIRRSTLTELQTARLGAAMCRTLAYVHARGIVHCDIKPANILISGNKEDDLVAPKLADFGIATAGNGARPTTNGAAIGTANYLSPEQVRGHRTTAATDIYALGLVLIEALTGALAYPGTGVTAATARLNRSAIIPHDASRGLRTVLAEMTARDPLDRPDAGRAAGIFEEIAAGFDGSLTDEILMLGRPVADADEPTAVSTLRAPRRRIRLAAAAAVVLAGCAALTATLTSTGSRSPRPAPQTAPQAAAPNLPTPSSAEPTQIRPLKVRPAPQHKPAPTRTPAQIAALGVLHVQPATIRQSNGSPKQHPKNKDTHPKHAHGKRAPSKRKH
jgi:serine/threonine protein kinase